MAANKVRGARAALCNDLFTASCPARTTTPMCSRWVDESWRSGSPSEILKVWLDTPFDGGRHQRRLDELAAIEEEEHTA